MPRTKQSRKIRISHDDTDEIDSLVKDFETQVAHKIHKIEGDFRMHVNSIGNTVDLALTRWPMEVRKLTLGELLVLDVIDDHKSDDDVNTESMNESLEKPPTPVTVSKAKKNPKRVTAASDDGYATESTTTRTTHLSRINTTRNSTNRPIRTARSSSNNNKPKVGSTRVTRSSSKTDIRRQNSDLDQENKNNLVKNTGRCPSSTKYKTPAMKKSATCYGIVTPKVKPNTPMNILRRPREGEMVLSMQGSPLLVSAIVQERTANLNVPLHNGNIISLLPNAGLRLSHMPALDDETMQQLKTLKGHIDKVIGFK